MTRPTTRFTQATGVTALTFALIAVACGDEVLPPDEAAEAPGMRASTAATGLGSDTIPPEFRAVSAVDPAGRDTADAVVTTEAASIVLDERSDVTVDVAFTETAARNTLRIVEPISEELASGNPISGSFRFGPFDAGTVVAFDLLTGTSRESALQRLNGRTSSGTRSPSGSRRREPRGESIVQAA